MTSNVKLNVTVEPELYTKCMWARVREGMTSLSSLHNKKISHDRKTMLPTLLSSHYHPLILSLSPGMKNIFQTTKLFKEFFWWQISQYSGKKSGDLCMQKSPDMRVDKLAAVSMCWGWRNSAIFIIFSRTHTAKAWQIFILKKFIVLTQT